MSRSARDSVSHHGSVRADGTRTLVTVEAKPEPKGLLHRRWAGLTRAELAAEVARLSHEKRLLQYELARLQRARGGA